MDLSFIFEVLRALAELAEKFPDNPRLGRKLLLAGGVLFCAIFVPDSSPQWSIFLLIFKFFTTIVGAVCMVLGASVFFRRWVWKRQENRQPVISFLKLK